jgi:hypothetical protein
MNGEEKVSDDEGKTYFTVYPGASSYSFQKISYRPEEGIMDVKSDTLLQFLLTRTHANVKISLREGNTPVNNVMVRIGEDSLLSNSMGLAKFLQLPISLSYHFTAHKKAYLFKEGDFQLSTDTTIVVSMEKLPSAVSSTSAGTSIRIWPNPTSGLLYIELPVRDPMKVQILDLKGVVIRETMTSGTEELRLNLSPLPEGLYTLYISGDQGTFRKLILKL